LLIIDTERAEHNEKTNAMLLAIPLFLLAQDNSIVIEAGKLIEYRDLTLRAERVDTTNLYDVVFYEMSMGQTNRVGKCDKANIEVNKKGILTINFRDVTIEMKNPAGGTTTIEAGAYAIRVDTSPFFFHPPR
jgi:hypothetical protein